MRGVTWKLATKKLQSAIKLLRHYPQRHYVFLIMYISEGKIRPSPSPPPPPPTITTVFCPSVKAKATCKRTQPLSTLLAQQCCERLHVARRFTTGFKLC